MSCTCRRIMHNKYNIIYIYLLLRKLSAISVITSIDRLGSCSWYFNKIIINKYLFTNLWFNYYNNGSNIYIIERDIWDAQNRNFNNAMRKSRLHLLLTIWLNLRTFFAHLFQKPMSFSNKHQYRMEFQSMQQNLYYGL